MNPEKELLRGLWVVVTSAAPVVRMSLEPDARVSFSLVSVLLW